MYITRRTTLIASIALIIFSTFTRANPTPLGLAATLGKAQTGHYVSPVMVNGGGPFEFVVDTGAEGCAVYQDFADQLDLKIDGEESLIGQTGAASVSLTVVDSIITAGVAAGPLSCVILPPRRDGAKLAGIVGLDSMAEYAVYFSPSSQKLAFYESGTQPTTILGNDFVAVDARNMDNTLLTFPISINGAEGIAILDSGARRTVINGLFAKAAGIHPENLSVDKPLYGAAGIQMELRHGMLGTLEISGHKYPNSTGTVGDLPVFAAFGAADKPAMILGLDFLANGAMLVDFPEMKVFIARH